MFGQCNLYIRFTAVLGFELPFETHTHNRLTAFGLGQPG